MGPPLGVWEGGDGLGELIVLGTACFGVFLLTILAAAVAFTVAHNRRIRRDESTSDD